MNVMIILANMKLSSKRIAICADFSGPYIEQMTGAPL
jgi:hypothetical protein